MRGITGNPWDYVKYRHLYIYTVLTVHVIVLNTHVQVLKVHVNVLQIHVQVHVQVQTQVHELGNLCWATTWRPADAPMTLP